MATINGTPGNDFIHAPGDGLTPPPGYNNIPLVTNDGDNIDGGAGADIIHAGTGNDTVTGSSASDWDGVAKVVDGGQGSDTVVLNFDGSADLSSAQISSIENLGLGNAGALDVKLSAAQISSFTHIEGSKLDSFSLAAPGDVELNNPNELLVIGGFHASNGNDIIHINAIAISGFDVDGASGNDLISFNYNGHAKAPQKFTITGGNGDDTLTGTHADFNLDGGDGKDVLSGGKLADTLDGGSGKDKLTGGDGQDQLTGGDGRDTFIFKALINSTVASPDTITDFSSAAGDIIDLSKISTAAADHAFHLGGTTFTHSAGELIQTVNDTGFTVLQGDADGDGTADFAIQLTGKPTLTSADFHF